MANKEKVCLILGANGFIGSYLVEHLAQQPNIRVRALDRFSREPQFSMASNIEIIRADMFDDTSLRSAIVGVDYVMHCFSATTPFVSDNNPYVDVTDNLLRSIKVFDICAAEGVEKIGFVSSGGAVYGSLSEHKIASEEDSPLPVSPYGINKLAIEHYLEYFKRKHGTQYVVYRVTNPYGPRQITKHNQGVIPSFLKRIRNGEEIVIYGDGTTSRDYIYIEDAAAMIADTFRQNNKYPVYNIGRGTQISINQIVEELKKISGYPVKVVYEDEPKTFLRKTGVSIERFRKEFGEREFTSLHNGLVATVKASE